MPNDDFQNWNFKPLLSLTGQLLVTIWRITSKHIKNLPLIMVSSWVKDKRSVGTTLNEEKGRKSKSNFLLHNLLPHIFLLWKHDQNILRWLNCKSLNERNLNPLKDMLKKVIILKAQIIAKRQKIWSFL